MNPQVIVSPLSISVSPEKPQPIKATIKLQNTSDYDLTFEVRAFQIGQKLDVQPNELLLTVEREAYTESELKSVNETQSKEMREGLIVRINQFVNAQIVQKDHKITIISGENKEGSGTLNSRQINPMISSNFIGNNQTFAKSFGLNQSSGSQGSATQGSGTYGPAQQFTIQNPSPLQPIATIKQQPDQAPQPPSKLFLQVSQLKKQVSILKSKITNNQLKMLLLFFAFLGFLAA